MQIYDISDGGKSENDMIDNIDGIDDDNQPIIDDNYIKVIYHLQSLFAFLSDKPNRILIYWYHLMGYSDAEISNIINITPQAVYDSKMAMLKHVNDYPAILLLNYDFAKPYHLNVTTRNRSNYVRSKANKQLTNNINQVSNLKIQRPLF